MKKTNWLSGLKSKCFSKKPSYKSIVAAMVIAAVAGIGGQASADTLYRIDTGSGATTWATPAEDKVWGPLGGVGTTNDTTSEDNARLDSLTSDADFSDGFLLTGTGVMKSLTVTGTGWGLHGHFESASVTVLNGSSLLLKNNQFDADGDTVSDQYYNFGAGTVLGKVNGDGILKKGVLEIENGAMFAQNTPLTLDGGQLSLLNAGDPTTRFSSPLNLTLGALGGILSIDGGLDVTQAGTTGLLVTDVDGADNIDGADFTRTGGGTLFQAGSFGIGNGTATYEDGVTRITSERYRAGALVVTGANTFLEVKSGYSVPNVTITDTTTVSGGAQMILGPRTLESPLTNPVFSTGSLVIEGTDSRFTVRACSQAKVTSGKIAVQNGGTLALDIAADYSNFTAPEIMLQDGGNLTLLDETDAGITNAKTDADLLARGADNTLTYADDINLKQSGDVTVYNNSKLTKTGGWWTINGFYNDRSRSELKVNGNVSFSQETTIDGTVNADRAHFLDNVFVDGTVSTVSEGQLYFYANVDGDGLLEADYAIFRGVNAEIGNKFVISKNATFEQAATISGDFTTETLTAESDLKITGKANLLFNESKDGIITGNLELGSEATLTIGTVSTTDTASATSGDLRVNKDFVSNGGTLQLSVDAGGKQSTLTIDGTVSIAEGGTGTTILMDTTVNADKNLNVLGKKLHDLAGIASSGDTPGKSGKQAYIALLVTASNENALDDEGEMKPEVEKAFVLEKFFTSKYTFTLVTLGSLSDNPNSMAWGVQPSMQSGGLPSLSSMFLVNIIGFDLPRAQNVSGPWIRVKGGHVYDNMSNLGKTSYQVMQIGWDKSFKAAHGSGEWYSGIFLEGDWMYSNGDYKLQDSYKEYHKVGYAKASNVGMGVGLYVSRAFDNGWYLDAIGRMNVYESKNKAVDTTSDEDSKNRYGYKEARWTDKMFALGLEIGKNITSKSKRWSLNPYERVIYNSSPGNDFRIEYEDATASDTMVRNRSVDAWTNQLGVTLAYNSLDRDGNTLGNVFIKGEYFRGLSGDFITEMHDYDHVKKEFVEGSKWEKVDVGRKKNDLNYGNMGVGAMYKPVDCVVISGQTDFLFGDVSGWSVTFGGRYSY